MKLRLATRGSDLALWQATHVAQRLTDTHPELEVELFVLRTTGDRVTDVPLSRIGETGLFTAEIDCAVVDGRADAAVHSLKDIPTELNAGIRVAAVLERADPSDAFLPAPGRSSALDRLPPGSRVATSSLRRRSLLLSRRPDLRVEDLRGNLDTRLRKLGAGSFDAAILALAGLRRIGREDAVGEVLDAEEWLPAVGQGALAVTTRAGDAQFETLVHPLDHVRTRVAVTAERGLLQRLHGGCQVPIGALASVDAERVVLRAFVGSVDGRQCLRASREGSADDPDALAAALVGELCRMGAGDIIAGVRRATATHVPPITAP